MATRGTKPPQAIETKSSSNKIPHGTSAKPTSQRASIPSTRKNQMSSSGATQTESAEMTYRQLQSQDKQRQSQDLFGEDYESGQQSATKETRPALTSSDMENYSVSELESYAIAASQDVTQNIYECKKIVGDTTSLAAATMEQLHEQGGQIERFHGQVVTAEESLTVGEKLLGSLGGIFSRRWKPKKGPKIKGPTQNLAESYRRKKASQERAAVLSRNDQAPAMARHQGKGVNRYEGLSGAQVQIEMEREHQEEALSELGSMVSNLKTMTSEMNEEVLKQNSAMDLVQHDLDAVGGRVKQSYQRARYLTGG